eukprot:13868-Heterococcus_DN1.PRE.3
MASHVAFGLSSAYPLGANASCAKSVVCRTDHFCEVRLTNSKGIRYQSTNPKQASNTWRSLTVGWNAVLLKARIGSVLARFLYTVGSTGCDPFAAAGSAVSHGVDVYVVARARPYIASASAQSDYIHDADSVSCLERLKTQLPHQQST